MTPAPIIPTTIKAHIRAVRDWLRDHSMPALVIPADGEAQIVEERRVTVEDDAPPR